jgi:hypothetical protein
VNKVTVFIPATVAVAGAIFFLYGGTLGQKVKGNKPDTVYSTTNVLQKQIYPPQQPKPLQTNSSSMQTPKDSSEKIMAYSANLVKIIDNLDISSPDQFDILNGKSSPVTQFNRLIDKLLLDKAMWDSEKASLIWGLLGKYDPNSPVGLKLLDVLASVNGSRYFSHELMDMFASSLTQPAAQANIAYVLSGMLRNPQFANDTNFPAIKDFIGQQFYATNDKNVLKALLDFSASSFGAEDGISDNTFALSVLESKKSLLTEAERMSYRLAFTSPANLSGIIAESFATQKSLQPEVQDTLYGRLKDLSAFTYPNTTARQVLDTYLNRNQPNSTLNGNEYLQKRAEWLEMKAIANSNNRQDYQNYLFDKVLASTDTVEKATILSLAIKDAEDLEKPELLNRLLTSTTIQQDIETRLAAGGVDNPSVRELFGTILSGLK